MAKLRIKEDKHYELLEANQRFREFFGETPSPEILNITHWKTHEAIEHGYERMLRREFLQFEASAYSVKGSESWFQISGEYVGDIEHDPIYYFIFIDITEQKKSRDKIDQLAFVDPVTGGYNRNRFEIEMKKCLKNKEKRNYYFISLNIEKFKLINDVSGLEKGDQTLRYIHNTFIRCLHDQECFGRFAADKFVALLEADDDNQISSRLYDIVQKVNRFNDHAENKYYINFKAGIFPVINHHLPFATMYDRANMAIKNADFVSDNHLLSVYFYTDADRQNLMKEKEIENKIDQALSNHEFVVYLQPKVSVQTKSISGAEALVRWNDPEEGLLFPNSFIPILEKYGSIVKLDLYVFEQVCALIRKWLDAGYKPVPISVNMSRIHLGDLQFLDHYEKIRKKYEIPASYIEFELTETIIFDNPEAYTDVIKKIHKAGYSCSMDDFGSGYSSLNILRDIPFDCLKLDRTFFTFEDDKRGEDIIESVIDMAKKLGMVSVAEGVETKQQVAFLEQTACDLIQGYVFSKPVPLAVFEKLKYQKVIE